MGSNFQDFLRTRRTEIDQHLSKVLRPRPGLPEQLREAMCYSLLAPGKRLRPLLVLLAAEAAPIPGGNPWPAACAVEMVHVYSLIHDDLPAMDDDDLRRGLPTCHKKFGEATAILAGDALLTMAFEVLASNYPPRTATSCCLALACAAGAAGMVGGQMDDLAAEQRPIGELTLNDLESLHARKTGALIRAALRLGIEAAHAEAPTGPSSEWIERFDRYGECLGLAFQITDDLLDVQGQTAQAGKRVGKDAARGKLTYPGLLGVEESRLRAEILCRQAREAIAPLGERGRRLDELAEMVLHRDH
jgi:geranylgeranyl diphosphate synthase type II